MGEAFQSISHGRPTVAAYRLAARAALLFGAADVLWRIQGIHITSQQMLIFDHEACERQAPDALGDAAFTDAFRQGQATCREDTEDTEDTSAYALDEPRQTPRHHRRRVRHR